MLISKKARSGKLLVIRGEDNKKLETKLRELIKEIKDKTKGNHLDFKENLVKELSLSQAEIFVFIIKILLNIFYIVMF